MNVDVINPFLSSLLNVLSTMANISAKPGKPTLKGNAKARGDITGIMGMSGNKMRGSISITLSKKVALKITANMLGEQLTEITPDVLDLTGEITNMVTGGAKNLLGEKGYDFDMATPTVINGSNHEIHHKSNSKAIIVPFSSEAGEFFVEVCMEEI